MNKSIGRRLDQIERRIGGLTVQEWNIEIDIAGNRYDFSELADLVDADGWPVDWPDVVRDYLTQFVVDIRASIDRGRGLSYIRIPDNAQHPTCWVEVIPPRPVKSYLYGTVHPDDWDDDTLCINIGADPETGAPPSTIIIS